MNVKKIFKLAFIVPLFTVIQFSSANALNNTTPSSQNGVHQNLQKPYSPIIAQRVRKTGEKPYSHENIGKLKGPFKTPHEVTKTRISCHRKEAEEFAKTVHWLWIGPAPDLIGHENISRIGKTNTINNFCIAIISNWGRCTQCHAGYGWKDPTYNFSNLNNIDCLVCHEQTGKYKKHPLSRH